MKNILLATAVLMILGPENKSALFAEEATSASAEAEARRGSLSSTSSLKKTQSTQNNSDVKEDQAQKAAWMIESIKAANEYVENLDREQYAQSWSKGDQLFQHTISKEEWVKVLNQKRKILGRATSRKLKDQRPAMNPQGLPLGAYMVVEFNTSFERTPSLGELLTLRRGSDGVWRVLTYQLN